MLVSRKLYPISFNGKKRFTLEISAKISKEDVEGIVLKHPKTAEYLKQNSPKKVIVVPKKIVNIVF